MAFQGTFHRQKSPTQTDETALLQVASQEVWGRPARWSSLPSVKAYPRAISPGVLGIEFDTSIDPRRYSTPGEARWYLDKTPGVEERFDAAGDRFACIPAKVRNHQS